MVESFWMIAKILHRAKQEKRDDNAVIFFYVRLAHDSERADAASWKSKC